MTLRTGPRFTPERKPTSAIAVAVITALAVGCAAPSVPEITVGGDDYAFIVTDSIPSGPVRFTFENRGQVRHEMVLVQLAEGATLAELGEAARSEDGDPFQLISEFGGVLIAGPGTTAWGRLQVDLEPGRTYALLCNFQDAEDAPPHTELGMVKEFVVE